MREPTVFDVEKPFPWVLIKLIALALATALCGFTLGGVLVIAGLCLGAPTGFRP